MDYDESSVKLGVMVVVLCFLVACAGQNGIEDGTYPANGVSQDFESKAYEGDSFIWNLLYDFDGEGASPFLGLSLSVMVRPEWAGSYRLRSIVNAFETLHNGVSVDTAVKGKT